MSLFTHKEFNWKIKLLFLALFFSFCKEPNAVVPKEMQEPLEICFAPALSYINLPIAFNKRCDELDQCNAQYTYESEVLDCFNVACIKTSEEFVFLIKSYSSSGSERTALGIENVPHSLLGVPFEKNFFEEISDDGVLIRFLTSIADGDVGDHYYELDKDYQNTYFNFNLDSVDHELVHGSFSLKFKLRSESSIDRPAPKVLEFTEGSFSTYITYL